MFFSFWVLLLGSSGFFWVFFWCSSGVLLVFDNTEEHQKNPEEPRRTPEEHQKNPEEPRSKKTQKEKNTEHQPPRFVSIPFWVLSHFGCIRSGMPVKPTFHTGGPTAGWADRRPNRLPRPPAYLGFSSRGTAGWNAGVWVCVAQPTPHTPQTPQLNTGSSNRRRSAIVFWSSSCIFFSCRSTCVLVAFWFIEG